MKSKLKPKPITFFTTAVCAAMYYVYIGTLVPMCRLLSVSVDGISTHTLVLTLQSASFPLAELWHDSFSHNSAVSYTR